MPPASAKSGATGRVSVPLRRVDPALLALTLLAFALAAYRLGSKSLWLDEAVSADHARLGWHGLWTVISHSDPNMGLYYVLLHLWVRVFGYDEAAVRSLTVLLGGLAVPVMALLGKRLFGRNCGLLAGVLLAISPFFVQYEQTARSYALVVLLVLLSCWFFLAALQRPTSGTLAGYAASSVLTIYAHYFAALVLLVQLATLLALRRRDAFAPRWLAVAGAIVVLCAPEALFAHRAGTGGVSWIHVPTLGTLVRFPGDVAGGKALAAVLIVLACYAVVRAVLARESERWRVWFLVLWLVGPVVLVFAVSRLGRPLFVTYYLIVVLPAFLLLAARGATLLPGRAPAAVAAALLIACSAVGLRDWYRSEGVEGYREATRYILAEARPADGVLGYPAKTVAYGLAYYEALAHARGPTPVAYRLGSAPLAHPPRIWVVLRQSDVSAQEERAVRESIAARYAPVGSQPDFTGLHVLLYRLKAAASRAAASRAAASKAGASRAGAR